MSDKQNYKLKVAYKGENFCGFARQNQVLTVQGELERVLKIVLREEVQTVCAGRTDRGVHAREQVVNFVCNRDNINPSSFVSSVNALIDSNISTFDLVPVDKEFSARFSAKWREYRYFIFNGKERPTFTSDFCWHVVKPLDLQAMQQAAQFLIGEKDFKSFCLAKSAIGKTTVREILSIDIDEVTFFDEQLIQIKVCGNAFLHSMVRAIVGSLVDVGKGNKTPKWIESVLVAKDRKVAGENAPANGLVFWHVEY